MISPIIQVAFASLTFSLISASLTLADSLAFKWSPISANLELIPESSVQPLEDFALILSSNERADSGIFEPSIQFQPDAVPRRILLPPSLLAQTSFLLGYLQAMQLTSPVLILRPAQVESPLLLKRQQPPPNNGSATNRTGNTSNLLLSDKQVFTGGIWMGLFMSLLLLGILVVAVWMTASVQTPTKFQQAPKLKKQ